MDYALNRDKTESVCFETGLSCLCETAFADMKENVQRWHKTGGVQGYHLVQSFAEGEVTPELAHQIGVELADQLLGGRYQAVVTTHLNTRHIHNHIVWCAVALDNGRKYHSNAKSYYTEVRARSDALCRQYGLSVIETPESERGKRQYAKWQAEANGQPTWRTAIRMDVDEAIALALTWRQFLAVLERKGYEIRMGRKYPTLRPPGKERFVRFKTLGKSYTPEAHSSADIVPEAPLYTSSSLARPPARRPPQSPQAHRPAGFVLSVSVRTGRAAPQAASPPLCGAAGHPQAWTSASGRWSFCRATASTRLTSWMPTAKHRNRPWRTLLAERRQLHRAEPSDEIKTRLEQITQALKPLRQDIRLCRQIAEHSVQMRERLKQQAEKLPEQEKTTERESNREVNLIR